MRELNQSRFASVLTIILGAWLLLSPAFISISGAALGSLIVTGIVVVLAGLMQLFMKNSVPSWITGIAAVYLLITAFSFSVSNAVAWNQVLSAIIGFVLAVWDGFEISEFRSHHAHAM
jgi:hypothetical protein